MDRCLLDLRGHDGLKQDRRIWISRRMGIGGSRVWDEYACTDGDRVICTMYCLVVDLMNMYR
jgi:hypothetical protein